MVNSRFILTIIASALINIGANPSAYEDTPSFGTGIVLLATQNQGLYNAVLSPQGHFALAIVDEYSFTDDAPQGNYVSSSLSIWEADSIQSNGSITAKEPLTTLVINDDPSHYHPIAIALSPDERYVAIQLSDEVRVLTIPELNLYRSIEGQGIRGRFGVLTWAANTALLGMSFQDEFRVWNADTDQIHSVEIYAPQIRSIATGWLLDYFLDDPSLGFVFCSELLESCERYEYSNAPHSVATLDGRFILTESALPPTSDGDVGVWEYQSDGTYSLTDIIALEFGIHPRYFSPSGQYLYSDYDFRILSFPSLVTIYALDQSRYPVWLPNEEYFVSSGSVEAWDLMLHHVSEAQALARLDLFTLTNAQIGDEVNQNLVDMALGTSRLTMSDDGNMLLVDMGWVAVLVPISWR